MNEKWKFVAIYGVVFWGLLTAVIVSIFDIYFDQVGAMKILINFIIFALMGIVFGLVMWKLFKEKNKR